MNFYLSTLASVVWFLLAATFNYSNDLIGIITMIGGTLASWYGTFYGTILIAKLIKRIK